MNEMNTAEMNERIRKGKFADNNGKMLRAINVLRTKYVSLADLKYGLEPGMTMAEMTDSVNYLTEIDYIKLRHVETKQETTLADADFNDLEAKLSDKGIKFLNGKIADECVR